MNISSLQPPKPPAHTLADWSEVHDLQQRMVRAISNMETMAGDVAVARQVKEYNAEQRKRVLAVAAAPLLKAGASAAAADVEARATETYKAAMDMLGKQLIAAEETMARWEVLRLTWETARSLLSLHKEGMRTL